MPGTVIRMDIISMRAKNFVLVPDVSQSPRKWCGTWEVLHKYMWNKLMLYM